MIEHPSLPQYDATDPVESAVVKRLAGNWEHRATVKKAEPDLDDLFDPAKHDFPEALIPFAEHDTYRELPEARREKLRAWGWIAYNKNVMDVEQQVVNPGFSLLAQDAFETGLGDTLAVAVTQAMVDEQYHTLMHLNASVLTRRRRGWPLRTQSLPFSATVRRRQKAQLTAPDSESAALSALAFTTVAEISITSYLDLIEDNELVQPVNRATVKLHNRDEYCHASIADDLAGIVFEKLDDRGRRSFLDGLKDGMDAFSSTDFSTWRAILHQEEVPDFERMLNEVETDGSRRQLIQDYSGIRALCRKLDVEDEIGIDWA
ncbi:diiron oxygenase [Rhodococcus sp. BP-252]|uniref:AurF N-oxygenase family protein n=1 Tax=unclassified Rhodococcus (in: high G+C Gram-positive bacteria) TaxID=192944 RepID=UPI001C9AE239|nr:MULTISPECIES: diiron oxygenase [unclassified Rhodococcus (in: high G+C Gram-positive bacteria)]MBY6410492.1 diiron oxygenase [Rhodococcus sp. BP-320]MBY6417787.1 diiron oxygenase [Rhodococcus sp. BP-321]MBY6420369.1 diiron oxygenase [Rhodococcus sp. BP-324]MBY6425048.1 diiron oxygenase [Rhodococcus sp. BP-323]MBY6430246.1 diiron oxygenase [Rhodococcus sp. BP-322]